MKTKEFDGSSNILCACGCGLHLSNRQAKKGIRFRNRTHANKWNGKNVLLGKKYNKIKKDEYDMRMNGRQYCKNYKKDELNCLLCVEEAIFKVRSCYKDPDKNEL